MKLLVQALSYCGVAAVVLQVFWGAPPGLSTVNILGDDQPSPQRPAIEPLAPAAVTTQVPAPTPLVEAQVGETLELRLQQLMARYGSETKHTVDGTAHTILVPVGPDDGYHLRLAPGLSAPPESSRQGRVELLPNWEVGRAAAQLIPNYGAGMASVEFVAPSALAAVPDKSAAVPSAARQQDSAGSQD